MRTVARRSRAASRAEGAASRRLAGLTDPPAKILGFPPGSKAFGRKVPRGCRGNDHLRTGNVGNHAQLQQGSRDILVHRIFEARRGGCALLCILPQSKVFRLSVCVSVNSRGFRYGAYRRPVSGSPGVIRPVELKKFVWNIPPTNQREYLSLVSVAS